MNNNPHSVRQRPEPPTEMSLINGKGQFQMVVAFRKGRCVEQYIRFRRWCWANDVNPTDVFNSLIEPITHFCENFARMDADGNIVVAFNLGEVSLERFYARSYVDREYKGNWQHPEFKAKQKALRPVKHRIV